LRATVDRATRDRRRCIGADRVIAHSGAKSAAVRASTRRRFGLLGRRCEAAGRLTSQSPRLDSECDGEGQCVRAAHQQPNVRRKVPGQARHDRPPCLRRMVSHVDRDDHSPPEHRAADLYGNLVLKLDGELPQHAFKQSRSMLLAAIKQPTEQQDCATGDSV
jgi:hypothetical protein